MSYNFAGKISELTIELEPMAIAIVMDEPVGNALLSSVGGAALLARMIFKCSRRTWRRSTDFRNDLQYVFSSERTSEKVVSAVHDENIRCCGHFRSRRVASPYRVD